MKSKIFYNIFAVAMVVFVLSLTITLGVLYDHYSDKYTEELLNEAYYLSAAIEIGGYGVLDTLSDEVTGRMTLVSASGDVIYDSLGELSSLENYKELEEFVLAEENGVGKSSRYSMARGAQVTYCAVKLSDGSIIRVSSIQYTMVSLVIDLITPVVFTFAVAILLSLLLAVRISSSITDPINKIDLDAPDGRAVYAELLPFYEKIAEQNRQIDKQMKEIRAEHEMQDAYRREFTANVSHELKTPLTTISGSAELMAAGLVKPEDVPKFSENIYSEAKRLIVLVNDIMELSRLDENAVPEMTNVDLYAVSDEAVNRLQEKAKSNNVTLFLKGNSTLVTGVEKIIYEIVHNLADNAVKYNKPGGIVTVTVGNGDDGPFVAVEDTGIGIPDGDRSRVFERFYRVDKSHSGDVSGTGLGLSIVKHGAMLHKAKIDLTSEEGVGTTVQITFQKQ